MDMRLTSLKLIIHTVILGGLSSLLLSSCFWESTVPLSPIEEASYPADLIDRWVSLRNKNNVYLVEKLNKSQLKTTFLERDPNKVSDDISFTHITHIDGQMFLNNKAKFSKRYVIYKIERPCSDLILVYLPNAELIEKDIKSGRLKGRIKQDFFTTRIIEESQKNLIKYIKTNIDELFFPDIYLVRQSQVGKLSEACTSKIKILPGDKK